MITNKAYSVRGFLQQNLAKYPAYVCQTPKLHNFCLSYLRLCLHHLVSILSVLYSFYRMVQRRAARFVMNKFSNYESVTQMLGWNTLKGRRDMLRAIMMYKIIHNIVDIQSHTYLTPTQLSTRGHHHRFQQLPTYVS